MVSFSAESMMRGASAFSAQQDALTRASQARPSETLTLPLRDSSHAQTPVSIMESILRRSIGADGPAIHTDIPAVKHAVIDAVEAVRTRQPVHPYVESLRSLLHLDQRLVVPYLLPFLRELATCDHMKSLDLCAYIDQIIWPMPDINTLDKTSYNKVNIKE